MKIASFLIVSASVCLYRRFLWLYPASFRLKYAEEMVQLFRDLCQDEMKQGKGLLGILELWLQVWTELGITPRRQHFFVVGYFRRQKNVRRILLGMVSISILISGWFFWTNGNAQWLLRRIME